MTDAFDSLTEAAAGAPSPEFVARLRSRLDAIESRPHTRPTATTPTRHLAQLNLGRFRLPLDHPEMADFANALDRINAIADASPGFVWRLTDDDGGPSSNVTVPGATDPLIASNLSVWTDLESLRDFMYRTDHGSYLRRRREWFQHDADAMTVLWWIPAGHIPTLDEALERLDDLRAHGPSERAWPLRRTMPPPTPTPTETRTDQREADTMLIPYLTVGDARAAIDFYAEVFDAQQVSELFEMADGRIGHAELSIGGNTLYLADGFPEMGLVAPAEQGTNSVSMVIEVDDCDATYAHALAAGASGERPPENAHGRRVAWFRDPWGHRWSPTSSTTS